MEKFSKILQANPKIVLGAFFLVVIAAFYPALQIKTDFNLENFFPNNDPTIDDYKKLETEFGRDDNTIMVGFKSDSLFSKKVLTDLRSITDSLKQVKNVHKVRSLWSATQITTQGNRLTFDPYLESASLQNDAFGNIKNELTQDPFTESFFVNKAGTVTAFYIEIAKGKNNFLVRENIIGELQQILRPYENEYDFKTSGIPHYRNTYVHYLNNEIIFYITLSSVLIILLLWGLYRSVPGILIPMIVVWFTILFALAVMQLTGGYFEVMTSTIAPILLCVGIADSIHMISKYDDARIQGLSQHNSITEMLKTLGSATFLTSITTAIGFGTLMTSTIVPMKRFGMYAAVGVMIAYLVTILLVPSALKIAHIKKVFSDRSDWFLDHIKNTLHHISSFNRKYYKKITIASIAFSLLVGSGIFFLKVNGKVFDELSEDTKPIQDAQFFSKNLSSPFPMEFIIDTGKENGITKPTFVNSLDNFTEYLRTYPEVQRVTSFNTLVKEVHKVMAPEKASVDAIPQSEQLLAQYQLLLEVSNTDFLERVTDFNYQQVRVAAQIDDAGSYRVTQIRNSLESYLSRHFPDDKITITGSTILSADLNNKIVTSLFKSILLAFVLISAIMAFLFRNVRMIFISLVPNILPLIIVAGIMGFTGIDIKSSTAVIFTIAFGIAVDDSIHYLARLRVEMKRGKTLHEALHFATIKTGKAIIVTSLILIAGFGTLLTSVFSSTVYMGLLVCITVFGALLADLFLLPSLVYWIKPSFYFAKGEAPRDSKSAAEDPALAAQHQE